MRPWVKGVGVGALALLLSAATCAHEQAPAGPAGTALGGEVFTRYTPLSRAAEIARRTLTPLMFFHGQKALEARGQALVEQQIDLSRERFSLYVPAGAPPERGYGLLVFVAPWSEATEPRRWRPPLDRHGLIFVAATGSGNETPILERRLPLALLAYENVRSLYPLDPERIYVAGFSGGARVAQMAAVAYPDVFRGALLHAGSDPVGGERGRYLPPVELFRRFQRTRLVYVTGDGDEVNLRDDRVSQGSMRDWCVLDVAVQRPRHLGHEALDAASLDRALEALDQRSAIDQDALARCNARVEQELAASLAEVEAALSRGDPRAARAKLRAVDQRFSGLAAPASLELDVRIEGP
jgi:pimeloyl-ACP methyl ester carboxylesterase